MSVILGTLCKHNHEHEGSGKSLRHVRRNGRVSDCVVCRKEGRALRYAVNIEASKRAAQAWYAEHREEVRNLRAAQYAACPEKARARAKEYRESHPTKIREDKHGQYLRRQAWHQAMQRERYYKDHDATLAKRQLWRDMNRDKIREQTRKYSRNPKGQEHSRRSAAVYRMRRREQMGIVTTTFKTCVLQCFDHKCPVCNCVLTVTSRLTPTSLTWDHIVPLSMNGRDENANLIPLCHSCNATKGPRTLIGWLGFIRAKEILDALPKST